MGSNEGQPEIFPQELFFYRMYKVKLSIKFSLKKWFSICIEKNSSLLLEGKVTGLTYNNEEAENLKYLAAFKDCFGDIHGITTVVHEYFTVTVRRCLISEWTEGNNYQGAYVSTLNENCNIEKIFEESINNDLVNPYKDFILKFDLAVIKVIFSNIIFSNIFVFFFKQLTIKQHFLKNLRLLGSQQSHFIFFR